MKLFVNTPRFTGVPFYLRTGKRLPKKVTEISLHYKKPALCSEDTCFFNPEMVLRNVLTIRIEPDEHITLRLMVKKPGFGMKLSPVAMSYLYKEEFASKKRFDAYEILILDAISGDQTLFAHTDEITNSWRVLSPLLILWQSKQAKSPALYDIGSWGPEEAAHLIQKDERKWYTS
jgi:glucose-6-phosphate 1-dehydrogenase